MKLETEDLGKERERWKEGRLEGERERDHSEWGHGFIWNP